MLAYSYLRFSSPKQAAGDSVRRQTAARDAWLAAHPGVALDTSLVMTDAGRSGFHRRNWDAYALAEFVAHVRSGRVPAGSYLLVENLDRLSRENAGEATELFLSIVNRGVAVVQLSPAVMEFRKPVDMVSLMFAIVELSRGHSESAIKCERSRAVWSRKHREATTRIVTRKLPGWVVERGGKLVLDPAKAATVRRMFALARGGSGCSTIARVFNAEGVAVLGRVATRGRPVAWENTTVHHVLTSRTTIGEFTPYACSRTREPGDAVPAYFPAVVDPETFYAVGEALKLRAAVGRGRRGRHVNLFAGLLVDARTGGAMTYRHHKKGPPTIFPYDSLAGRGAELVSFPAVPFERLLRARLAEVPAPEVAGEPAAGGRAAALEVRAAELRGLVAAWEAKMDDPAIVDRVAAKLGRLAAELSEVQAEMAARPPEVASAWGEVRTLAALDPDADTDELRLRIRSALRRSIESVTCLFMASRRRVRLAFVRVQFRGGPHRDYFLRAESASRGRPGGSAALAYRWPGGVDLRVRADVAGVLGRLDPERL